MALFGRESAADRERAERVRLWVQARSPYAVVSACLGLLASIDFFTIVFGLILGVAAIVVGLMAMNDLDRRPTLVGRPLAMAGIGLGGVGVALSSALWFYLRRHAAGGG